MVAPNDINNDSMSVQLMFDFRIGKNDFKRFLLLAVHEVMLSLCDIKRNTYRRVWEDGGTA